mmetsp:Transcript_32989/g.96294  ORF Transcript_32989/g.96294 Transcript_32989/m.96294 type:complete len:138 (+) Transcript_32989:127-540(+)
MRSAYPPMYRLLWAAPLASSGLGSLTRAELSMLLVRAEDDPERLAMKLLRHMYTGQSEARARRQSAGAGGDGGAEVASDGEESVGSLGGVEACRDEAERLTESALAKLSRADISALMLDMDLESHLYAAERRARLDT